MQVASPKSNTQQAPASWYNAANYAILLRAAHRMPGFRWPMDSSIRTSADTPYVSEEDEYEHEQRAGAG
jgi:hypothetical protein